MAHALQRARGSDLKAFVHIAYYTAARRRSIERLRIEQIDLKNSRINLHPEDAPATKKRKPIVPLYPEIRPFVEQMLIKHEGSEWLFGEPHDFYREFVKLCAVLGIKAHPHQLRHSRATHMLMDGEDPYRVARLLGDSLTTVDRNYGHTAVDYLATTSRVDDAGHEAELPIDSAIVPIRSRRRRDKRSTARAIETPRVLDFFVKPDAAEGEPPDATAAGVSEVGSEPAAGVSEQALADGAEGAEFRLVDLRTAVKELAASRGVDVTYELLLRFGASSASGVPVERRDDFIAEAERLAGRRARPADLASDVLHVPGQDHA